MTVLTVETTKFDDIRRFCELDGWERLSRARGGTGDHWRYRKILENGTILRTRASHSDEQIGDPGLWRHIWRDQLGLASEEEFWEALRTGTPAQRGEPHAETGPAPTLPAWIVEALMRQAAVPVEEVSRMSEAEARRRLDEFWCRPRDD